MTSVAYPRAEIEQTFMAFRAALERAMRSGDWSEWARFYTEDAVYVEHAMGTFRGRRAIHDWILRHDGAAARTRHRIVPHRLARHLRAARLGHRPVLQPHARSGRRHRATRPTT